MSEIIKFLRNKEATYQEMISANIGKGDEGARFKEELTFRLDEVKQAIRILEKETPSEAVVKAREINAIKEGWERLIYGVPDDHAQATAIKTCINDLEIVLSAFSHNP